MSLYVITQIKIPVTGSIPDIIDKARARFRRCSTSFDNFSVSRLSVDARDRTDVRYVASVCAELRPDSREPRDLDRFGITKISPPGPPQVMPPVSGTGRPVIVGFGPAGMFAALLLAEAGYRPLVIERGESVRKRAESVSEFYRTSVLSEDSNIQFGAGGAGTFSDGKLVTRINDSRCSYVIDRFIGFGAPPDIAYRAKPHIGSDNLLGIVESVAKRIEDLGGSILYNSKMTSINCRGRKVNSVSVSDGTEIECGALILAIGHSARDTFSYLIGRKDFDIAAKPFSVGVRIEHLQRDIDTAMYGSFADVPGIPHAEYALSHKCTDGRGVYTFCMCPGGEVVAAASEEGGIVTNGMSRYARDGVNANSAVNVSVDPSDYGGDPVSAIEFQRRIERAAFVAAGRSYNAPCVSVGEFLGRSFDSSGTISPTYMYGNVTRLSGSGFESLFPRSVAESLKEGICAFGRKISGFDSDHALLTAPETRTSSPLRIIRGENCAATGFDNLFPAGEGAGYAGGITSAAVDGIRAACALSEYMHSLN
ncbi:MAG: hypothetical protein J5933_06785 [Clostridia bacterium]|nr:hypothetical protein [Clostridia bacterium]